MQHNRVENRLPDHIADRLVADMYTLLRLMSGADARAAFADLLARFSLPAGEPSREFGVVRPVP